MIVARTLVYFFPPLAGVAISLALDCVSSSVSEMMAGDSDQFASAVNHSGQRAAAAAARESSA